MAATFTSTGTGNWNDGATWGNTSPGVKGTDWPGAVGDDAIVSVGHTVTYNVNESNKLLTIDTYGTLDWDTTIDTRVVLGSTPGSAYIIIRSGGLLQVGSSVTPIAASVTATLEFDTVTSSRGIYVYAGGSVDMYGDPAYYGSQYITSLANDAENTNGDMVIKTVDDMSAKWHVGDIIGFRLIKQYTAGYLLDSIVGTIQSFSGTSITIDSNVTCDAGVGDTWLSYVGHVNRNIIFLRTGTSDTIGTFATTTIPYMDNRNTFGNDNIELHDVYFKGTYFISTTGGGANFVNCSFFNCQNGIRSKASTITDIVMLSCSTGLHANCQGSVVTDGLFSICANAVAGLMPAKSVTCTGTKFQGCNYTLNRAHNCTLINCDISVGTYGTNAPFNIEMRDCYIYGGYALFFGSMLGSTRFINCEFGYDPGGRSRPASTVDLTLSYSYNWSRSAFINCKAPLAGYRYTGQNTANSSGGGLYFAHFDQVLDTHKSVQVMGEVIKVDADDTSGRPDGDSDGGNNPIIEVSTVQSKCTKYLPVFVFDFEDIKLWLPTGTYTYRFYVQTTYSGITAGNLTLRAFYLDTGSSGNTAETTHAPAINVRANDTDWTQYVEVTFTQATEGWVSFDLEFGEYQAGDEVWIDPIPRAQ